jgi:hypothetical protein
MTGKYFPEDRRLKFFEADEELAVYENITELQFGNVNFYFEEIPEEPAQEGTADDVLRPSLEGEFYELAGSPENPESTYRIGRSLAKFKRTLPIAARAGRDWLDDQKQVRRMWLSNLKALEKSIAREVKELIVANGEEACQWRGVTGK